MEIETYPAESQRDYKNPAEENESSITEENRVLCQVGEREFVIRDSKLGVDRLCKVSIQFCTF